MKIYINELGHMTNMAAMPIRAREIDKCKSVQPFHRQSAISVSFTETTDRPVSNISDIRR